MLNTLEAGVRTMEEYITSQAAELLYAGRPVRPDGKYDVRPLENRG